MFHRDTMINAVIEEGKKYGFSAIEVFRQRTEKKENERFVDYSAAHSVSLDRIIVRAFWDFGDPVGFSLSSPSLQSIRSAFFNLCSINIPEKRENYSHLLPHSVQKIKINIFDE